MAAEPPIKSGTTSAPASTGLAKLTPKSFAALPKEKKTMLGLGLGAGILYGIGAPILLPLTAAGGVAYLYWKNRTHPSVAMTPERQKVYEAALKDLRDSAKLRTLAEAFEKEGLAKEADMLRKRAALYELPKETQVARRQVFKAALKSPNVHGVEAVADAFEGEGATGAAEALRIHAAALRSV